MGSKTWTGSSARAAPLIFNRFRAQSKSPINTYTGNMSIYFSLHVDLLLMDHVHVKIDMDRVKCHCCGPHVLKGGSNALL